MKTKPPIGIPPYYIFYKQRAREIADAITRNVDYFHDIDNKNNGSTYGLIAYYCDELKLLLELEQKLEKLWDVK